MVETHLKIADERAGVRRAPRQERSRQTVEAVLDAVERVLRRDGLEAVTTNRIAEAAGVSIGSVYQYFPDKQSIFTALHQRHVRQVSQVIERTVAESASNSVADFTCALLQALMDAHDADPRLHEIISDSVPESTLGFRRALQATFEEVIPRLERRSCSPQMLFVLPHLVEALVHGGITHRPLTVSLGDLKQEGTRAVRAFLNAGQG
jgi:AcrR family transcriptional regulator